MLLFGLTLGLAEIALFAVFLIALVIAVTFDRHGKDAPKWYVFGAGLVVAGVYTWKSWTFSGAFDTLLSLEFWKPIAKYAVVGLVYSVVEFGREILNAKRYFAAKWTGWVTNVDKHRDVLENGPLSAHFTDVVKSVASFVERHASANRVISVVPTSDKTSVEPTINRLVLAEHIGSWTFFWPFYLVSLIVGDLFVEVFRQLSNVFATLGGRIVKLSFKDVFKV